MLHLEPPRDLLRRPVQGKLASDQLTQHAASPELAGLGTPGSVPSAPVCRGGPIAAPSAVTGDLAADRRGCALKTAGDRAHRLADGVSPRDLLALGGPKRPPERAGAQAARRRRARAGCCGSSRALDRAPGQCRLTDSPAFQRSHNSRRSAAVYTRRARATPTPSTGSSGPKCCRDGLNSPLLFSGSPAPRRGSALRGEAGRALRARRW